MVRFHIGPKHHCQNKRRNWNRNLFRRQPSTSNKRVSHRQATGGRRGQQRTLSEALSAASGVAPPEPAVACELAAPSPVTGVFALCDGLSDLCFGSHRHAPQTALSPILEGTA